MDQWLEVYSYSEQNKAKPMLVCVHVYKRYNFTVNLLTDINHASTLITRRTTWYVIL